MVLVLVSVLVDVVVHMLLHMIISYLTNFSMITYEKQSAWLALIVGWCLSMQLRALWLSLPLHTGL